MKVDITKRAVYFATPVLKAERERLAQLAAFRQHARLDAATILL